MSETAYNGARGACLATSPMVMRCAIAGVGRNEKPPRLGCAKISLTSQPHNPEADGTAFVCRAIGEYFVYCYLRRVMAWMLRASSMRC